MHTPAVLSIACDLRRTAPDPRSWPASRPFQSTPPTRLGTSRTLPARTAINSPGFRTHASTSTKAPGQSFARNAVHALAPCCRRLRRATSGIRAPCVQHDIPHVILDSGAFSARSDTNCAHHILFTDPPSFDSQTPARIRPVMPGSFVSYGHTGRTRTTTQMRALQRSRWTRIAAGSLRSPRSPKIVRAARVPARPRPRRSIYRSDTLAMLMTQARRCRRRTSPGMPPFRGPPPDHPPTLVPPYPRRLRPGTLFHTVGTALDSHQVHFHSVCTRTALTAFGVPVRPITKNSLPPPITPISPSGRVLRLLGPSFYHAR